MATIMADENNSSALLKFPTDFPIKVVGKANLDFQALVLNIMRKHVSDLSEGAVETRYSKDQNYIAITITIHATSKAQLDAIYQELSSNKQVVMVL